MCLAIPGRIVETFDDRPDAAKVEIGGVKRIVNVALVRDEGIELGDWVVVHVGFALSKIGEDEAAEQLRVLRLLDEEGEGLLDATR